MNCLSFQQTCEAAQLVLSPCLLEDEDMLSAWAQLHEAIMCSTAELTRSSRPQGR